MNGPQKVDINELLLTKEEKDAGVDDADGAMFSRVSSKREKEIRDINATIDGDDDAIIPVSFEPVSAASTFSVYLDNISIETSEPRNEQNDIDGTVLNDETDSVDNDKKKDNKKGSLGKLFGCNKDIEEGECVADHATFKREKIELLTIPKNKNKTKDKRSTCESAEKDNGEIAANENDNENAASAMNQSDVQDITDSANSRFKLKDARNLVLPFGAVLIFLADIGTDIELADSYRQKGSMDLFYATVGCIVIPSIIMAVVDLSWLWLDRGKAKGGNNWLRGGRVILGVLSFGRIMRAFSHMYHIVRKITGPDRNWHKQRALEEKRDCYMLDFINAFAESCPQLFVQMYLLYKFDLPLEFIRVFSLLTSWISIAWTYAAYYRCSREALSGRQDVNFFGLLLFFWSVLSTLAARVICVVLFLVYFKLWIGAVFLTVHYFIMLIWIIWQKPKLEGTTNSRCGRFFYELLFAYVSMMCFVNLKDTRARTRIILFYLVIYVENCVISGLVIWRMLSIDNTSQKPLNFIVLPVGFILHVTFLCLYYKCLHPKVGLYYKVPVSKDKSTS